MLVSERWRPRILDQYPIDIVKPAALKNLVNIMRSVERKNVSLDKITNVTQFSRQHIKFVTVHVMSFCRRLQERLEEKDCGKTRPDFWAAVFLGNYLVAMDVQGSLRLAKEYWDNCPNHCVTAFFSTRTGTPYECLHQVLKYQVPFCESSDMQCELM